MFYKTCIVLFCIAGCLSAPADDPIRVDLPVYDQPQASSNLDSAPEGPYYLPKYARSDKSGVGAFISQKLQAAATIGDKLTFQSETEPYADYINGYYGTPAAAVESAYPESEGYGSRKLTIKENFQGLVAGILQPKPIVDTIKEEEKYGNTGDKFYPAGRAIVNGAEGVSNLVNSVLEVPGTIFKKLTRIATEKLNILGGKLIGL